jgi:flagellar motor switch protein FliN/FliY
MTTATGSEAGPALAEVASSVGLRLDRSFDPASLSGLTGPFITVDIAGPDGGLGPCLVVRDSLDDGGEQLLQSLLFVVAGDRPADDGAPAATGVELAARFSGPFEVEALTDGQQVQAMVITAIERRQAATGARAASEAGSSQPLNVEAATASGFDKLSNVGLDVSVELGRAKVTLAEVLALDVGSVVELDRAAGAPVDVRVNGTLLAQGEVVLVDDEYAVRITAIIDPRANS